MTDEQPTAEPGHTSAPPPDWAPPPLSAAGNTAAPGMPGAQQFDTPAPDPASVEITRFAAKRSLAPILLGLVGLVVASLVVYSTFFAPAAPAPSPSPTPTHTPTSSTTPRPGTPFLSQSTGARGVWRVVDKKWDEYGLNVLVEVTVDTDELSVRLSALPVAGQDYVPGGPGKTDPKFPTTPIYAGQTVSGWAFFPIEHSPTTVFMNAGREVQISAVEVPA